MSLNLVPDRRRLPLRPLPAALLLALLAGSPVLHAAADGATLPSAAAVAALAAGQDYQSIQIASSSSATVLERQFARYAGLPFLRIERRGTLHVLRAGFWKTVEEAQGVGAAQSALLGQNPLVRAATYRPEAIVRHNWSGGQGGQGRPEGAEISAPSSSAPPVLSEAPAASSARPASRPSPLSPGAPDSSAQPVLPPPPSHSRRADAGTPLPAPRPEVGARRLPVTEDARMRPFDAEDYALAYTAFLGSGDRESAFRVARKAVASVPGDTEWRRKLARVAEWTQRPLVAWEQWDALFRQGDHSSETLAAVQRLAPLANQSGEALNIWRIRLQQPAAAQALSEAQWRDIYDLFQADSAALALEGSKFFEQQYRRGHKTLLLDHAARLAEDGGDDERALRLYSERVTLAPFSQTATLRAAILLLRRDRGQQAYELLLSQRQAAGKEAEPYWNLFIALALDLAHTETAEQTMRQLAGTAQAKRFDWPRLIVEIRSTQPERAAELALEFWRRAQDPQQFADAFEYYVDQGRIAQQKRLLAELSPQALASLERDSHFRMLRARHYQALRRNEAAWQDMQQALILRPESDEVLVSMLWFLIDQHRMTELRALMQRLEQRLATAQALWLPAASAYHALDQYRTALHWYRKEITRDRNSEDSLLLLNYADALDRAQQVGMAARVRQHAWLKLREKMPQPELKVPLDPQPELLARARLALLDAPGDPALALVRKVVAELRGLPEPEVAAERLAGAPSGAAPADLQTRDLVLGWVVGREQPAEARAWLWLNALRSLASGRNDRNERNQRTLQVPLGSLWAESQTSLQLNDTERMNRLLLEQGAALPIYNRYDTAAALEHWPLALDIAFQGMTASDVDEELYDRYRQHAPRHLNYVQGRAAREHYGAYDGRTVEGELHLVVERRLRLNLGWSQTAQSSKDVNDAVPPRQRLASVEAQWLGARGDTTLKVFRRSEQDSTLGLRLTQSWNWDARIGLSGELQRRGEATDSLPLRVAGQQDSLRASINYALSRREYLSLGGNLRRYYTQYGDYLGSGRGLDVEAGYRIRLEYPDWRVRLYASNQNFSYDGAPGARALAALPTTVRDAIITGSLDGVRYFLPQGSTTVGACFGMGENLAGQNLQETYTRAWRHFYDLCLNHNNINGAGYTGTLGVAGSVSGEDHFSLRMEQANGGTGAGTLSRVLAARYRYYF